MPCWFYDKKALFNTPSIQDGISHKTECQYRKEGAQLIIQIGSQMELGYNTLATGIVYFHRFYMFQSFKTFSPYVTACCCLFLAGKAEETPKKSKDIIKIARKFLNEEQLLTFGEDPREEVMVIEKILLQTMKFDLDIRHPYSFLLRYAKCLKGDRRKLQKMVQMAWTFINDSLCTTLSIQWEPEIIAIAVMYLATKLIKFKVTSWANQKPIHTYWWDLFVEDLNVDVVEDICHQVLDLYSPMSRYLEPDTPSITEVKSKNDVVDPLKSTVDKTYTEVVKDPRLETSACTVITLPLKDPRLESGSVFLNSHCNVNTPVYNSLIALPSPAMSNVSQAMSASLPDNSTISPCFPTQNLAMELEPQHSFGFPPPFTTFNAPVLSSADPSDSTSQLIMTKGFNNVDSLQTTGNQDFGCESNNNNDNYYGNRTVRYGRTRKRGFENNRSHNGRNHAMRHQGPRKNNYSNSNDCNENDVIIQRGFGYLNNKNDDQIEHRPLGNPYIRKNNNYDQTDDNNEHHPARQVAFGHSNHSCDNHNGIRPVGNRGFENSTTSDNNNNCAENQLIISRGFGNSKNDNYNENRSMGNRGFGNRYKNGGRYNENKPLFMSRGFRNVKNYNENFDRNNSTSGRMRHSRGNRFQPYARTFNNNKKWDDSRNKQPFYQPPEISVNTEEEESWD